MFLFPYFCCFDEEVGGSGFGDGLEGFVGGEGECKIGGRVVEGERGFAEEHRGESDLECASVVRGLGGGEDSVDR